jgi:hypothetical protein
VNSNLERSILRFLDIEGVIEVFSGRRVDSEYSLGSEIISRLELSFRDTACQLYTCSCNRRLTTMVEEVDT